MLTFQIMFVWYIFRKYFVILTTSSQVRPTMIACIQGFSSICYVILIKECGSTLCVGMAGKKHGRPYILIASDELLSYPAKIIDKS